MKVTPAHIVMPLLIIAVGAFLVYASLWRGLDLVWAAGGLFFITLGLSAIVLTLAWVLPDPLRSILRHPVVSIILLLAVLGTMALVVVMGLSGQIR